MLDDVADLEPCLLRLDDHQALLECENALLASRAQVGALDPLRITEKHFHEVLLEFGSGI